MAKVRLLNCGDYRKMGNVEFPVEVEIADIVGQLVYVSNSELSRVGATDFDKVGTLPWFIGSECELAGVSQ